MQFTPKKSFEATSRTFSSNSKTSSSNISESTGGRFIPSRVTSNLTQLFEKADQENGYSNKAPSDPSKLFSSILQSQLFGDSTNRQSSSNLLSYRSNSLNSTDSKENQTFSPMHMPEEDFSSNQRVLPKVPYKVLDAPQLQDDFYLNVLDWSPQQFYLPLVRSD